MSETVVIFRQDISGDCFALFPELPSDEFGNYCTAYQHIGQHCAADYHGCIANSDPATPDEYADLYRSAIYDSINMDLPVKVVTPEHLAALKMAAGRGKDDLDLEKLIELDALDLPKTRKIIGTYLGKYAAHKFDSIVDKIKWRRSREG